MVGSIPALAAKGRDIRSAAADEKDPTKARLLCSASSGDTFIFNAWERRVVLGD